MKKIFVLLMVVMMFGFTACGNQGETDDVVGDVSDADNGESVEETDTVAEEETEWTKGELVFDGKKLQLPCQFSELQALGWELMEGTELYEDLHLGQQVVFVENANYDSASVVVNAGIYSSKEGKVELVDCQVTSIVVAQLADLENEAMPSMVVNGLKIGDSKDKMIEILGEPNDYSGDASEAMYWYEEQGENISYEVSVKVTEGEITMLALQAYPELQ